MKNRNDGDDPPCLPFCCIILSMAAKPRPEGAIRTKGG